MNNQLEVIISTSGLEEVKAKYLIDNFKTCFDFAEKWREKAKTIVVTCADQKSDMAIARIGRLELKEKRLAIENSRKKLKEDIIKEGKTIDGIATMLKNLIEPIEEYLDQQEHFVEIQEKKKEDVRRAEVERRMAQEEEERRKAEAEKSEQLRLDNARLKKEAEERDLKAAEEQRKQNEMLAAERAKAKAIQDDADKKAREAKAKADAEKLIIENKAKAEREKAAEEQRKIKDAQERDRQAAKKKLDTEREENERLQELLKRQVTCPKCNHVFLPKVK